MKPSDPALDRLAVAKKLLLDPYGLDEAKLQRTLASIFEHRADYLSLPHTTVVASLPLRLSGHMGLDAEKKSGVIKLELTTDRSQSPLYSIELTIAAVISVKEGEENMPLETYAMSSGLGLLFPFVRETVANLTARGRFGPIWLHPFNFVAGVEKSGLVGATQTTQR